MRRFVLGMLLLALMGCNDSTPKDPKIRMQERVGGGVGPIGGTRSREYEGPVSQAPNWVKSSR